VTVRPDVVTAIIAAVGGMNGEDFGHLLDTASPEEINAVTIRLRDAALSGARPVPDVLEFSLWQLARLAAQGRAFEHIGGLLPLWRSWPDKPLSTVLKTTEPRIVAEVRSTLRRAGLPVDPGETGALDDEHAT
jgi:hypothetical protein